MLALGITSLNRKLITPVSHCRALRNPLGFAIVVFILN